MPIPPAVVLVWPLALLALVYGLGLWHSTQEVPSDEPPVPAWVKAIVGISLLPGMLFLWFAVIGIRAGVGAD